MIRCEGVGYRVAFGGGARTILSGITMTAEAGAITLVQGRSGAGKSTLMSIVAGVLRPTEGEVSFDGAVFSRYTAAHRDAFRAGVGFVPQRLHLFEDLTAIENVLLPSVPRGGAGRDAYVRAMELLLALDVPRSELPLRTLSGGEQQRVAIARALCGRPRLLVADEPTAHQDDERTRVVLQALFDAAGEGATVLISAHDRRVSEHDGIHARHRLQDGRWDPEGAG